MLVIRLLHSENTPLLSNTVSKLDHNMFLPHNLKVTKLIKLFTLGILIITIWVAALFLAEYVSNNDMAQNLVGQFGYFGILALAVIAGVNVLIPVPAATFVPVFTAAGLWLPLIIVFLVIGTVIADYLGYFVGHWSREFAEEHYPKTYTRIMALNEGHHNLLLPFVFLYAALIPFPNEAIIIPLALIGIRFRTILIPLILGNAINQTALAYGASNIFALFF